MATCWPSFPAFLVPQKTPVIRCLFSMPIIWENLLNEEPMDAETLCTNISLLSLINHMKHENMNSLLLSVQ